MKPNIVFITTDTQGQNMVSAYGKNPAARTPSIDRLAEEGVLFENSYCSTPVCTPARSTWYTGLPPNRNGAMTNDIALFRHIPMLAELLGVSGYDCYHLGKWHLDAGSYAGRGFSQAGFNKAVWYDQINFIEDVGKEGINRFGASYVPMDEALARSVVDLSGRPFLSFHADLQREIIGVYPAALTIEFFRSLADNAKMTLHIDLLRGDNAHHCVEAIFKAVARSLRQAVEHDPRVSGVPSTKGVL